MIWRRDSSAVVKSSSWSRDDGCAIASQGSARLVELERGRLRWRARGLARRWGIAVMGRKAGSWFDGSQVDGRRRCGGEVACAELAVDFGEREADAVAIGERRGWVELEFGQRRGRWRRAACGD